VTRSNVLQRGMTRGLRSALFIGGVVVAVVVSGCSSSVDGTGSSSVDGTGSAGVPNDAANTITVTYPVIAPVRLPDTSILGTGGDRLSTELSSLKGQDQSGLVVVSATCDLDGNRVAAAPDVFTLTEVSDVMNVDGSSRVTLRTDKDGTKHYVDLGGGRHLRMTVHPDGSGTITDLGGDRHLNVLVNKNGSGEFTDLGGGRHLTIRVKADGSGKLTDLGGDRHLIIRVKADGSGKLTDLGGGRHLTITIHEAGRAEMLDLGGGRHLSVTVSRDGSGHYLDLGGDRYLNFTVGSDGTVSMTDLGGGRHLTLTVNADGSGQYHDTVNRVRFAFDKEGRATDGSGLAIALPRTPVFSAPDRFPSLGKFGLITPPCATVLNFAADALFDFDKDTLRPEGRELAAKAAAVLAEAGQPIQVEGHTDSLGSDAYNDDLSLRRAEAFAAALKEQGVDVAITTKGWGEKRPVAPNATEDGKDNPSGRALNRRVEVIVQG
jgi:outer membrane protein OmpA-like peptidoglycan-associated protein